MIIKYIVYDYGDTKNFYNAIPSAVLSTVCIVQSVCFLKLGTSVLFHVGTVIIT